MADLQVNPAFMFAAAHGHLGAQSDLALALRHHAEASAEDAPWLADQYFTAAELFAELACQHGQPHDLAVKASIFAARSIHSAASDPMRSLEYRENAEQLFDAVEDTGDGHALGVIGLALNKLADADPDDDRASARLNQIIESLSPGEAQLLRHVARPAKCEPVEGF
jgi:hypothetical protein